MAIPKYDELYRPIITVLSDGNAYKLKELRVRIANDLHLTQEDITQMLPSGRATVYSNRVSWACTYLVGAGLIERPERATFRITNEGMRVFSQRLDMIDNAFLQQYPSFREFVGRDSSTDENEQPPSSIPSQESGSTPDDIMENAFLDINRQLQNDLMSEIMRLSPTNFEQMVIDLMSAMGYGTFENASTTTRASGDEGIDGIIMQDKLGFDLIYVQTKLWEQGHVVGRPEIQAFVGAIAGQTGGGQRGKGLFVTTSKFSAHAVNYAENQHIILIDGDKLTRYMIEYNFGVSVRKTFQIKVIDTDLFIGYAGDN